MACPKCGGMVLVKPPEANATAGGKSGSLPGAPAAQRSPSETGETKPDLSNPLKPLPPLDPAVPLKADAFDDIDVLLGEAPGRNMVPAPTVRPSPTAPHAAPAVAKYNPPPTTSVIRPAEQKKESDSQAQTLSQNDIAVAKPEHRPVTVKTQPHAPAAEHPAKPAEPAPRAAAAAAALPAAKVAPPAAAATSPGATEQSQAPAPELPAAGTLAGSPWQYWAMVSASGLLGILLAVGVVALTISWFSSGAQKPFPLAASPTKPEVRPNSANPVQPTDPTQPPATPGNPPAQPMDVVAAPMPVEQPEPLAPAPTGNEPPMTAPMPVAPMPPAVERDPLGLTDPPPAVKPMLPADDPFKKFGEILGGPSDPMPPEQPPAPAAVVPAIEDEPNPSPTAAKIPKPEPRHIDIAARLADPLPAIEIANAPLADFLQVMQDLSTVPITLRPDGLAMVRVTPFTPDTPVTWKGSSTTVLDAIQGALQPLGLEAKVEADQLIVDVASSQLVMSKLAVKDLTGSDERRAAELAALLMTFVAPDSWSDEDNQPTISASKDELTVRQLRGPLAECFLLVEKLRVARGLRPASKFDPKLFELTTRSDRAKTTLATPLTLNYSIPTPLLRVTDRLGKDVKARILFDWQSLSAAGWNPDVEVTLTVEKQPLSAALTDLTRRMDLTWRVVDGRTIQILSPQTLADRTELEFYSVADLAADEATGAALIAKLRTALGGQVFRDAGGRGELRFDTAGKCLIASLSQPQQQQLAAQLKALRAP